MKIKFLLIGAFLFGFTYVKAQELPKPQPSPPPSPPSTAPPPPPPQMDVPVPVVDTAAVIKEANNYLKKIKKILSKDEFVLYRKKEAKLVPSGNPFGLLKVRENYYKILEENKSN